MEVFSLIFSGFPATAGVGMQVCRACRLRILHNQLLTGLQSRYMLECLFTSLLIQNTRFGRRGSFRSPFGDINKRVGKSSIFAHNIKARFHSVRMQLSAGRVQADCLFLRGCSFKRNFPSLSSAVESICRAPKKAAIAIKRRFNFIVFCKSSNENVGES